ncbi:MAG: hypothetical protein ACETWG_08510 [Candidatus Neomarinimicrobiota bacterium]
MSILYFPFIDLLVEQFFDEYIIKVPHPSAAMVEVDNTAPGSTLR